MNFDPIVDPFPPVRPSAPSAGETPEPQEVVEQALAAEGETRLTSALAALKRKGQRSVQQVEAVLSPTHRMVGASVVLGLGALAVYAWVRRRAPRRPTIASAVGRSIARELAARAALAAAATVGARLAETVLVPMLVASLSAHSAGAARRAPRARRSKPPKAAVQR
jgi:hypothetical protein